MRENIKLNGRDVIICHPEKPNGKWALKTEYFDAFPDVQNILLRLGYYVVHIKNKTLKEENKNEKENLSYFT